jgi:hypothetical protein
VPDTLTFENVNPEKWKEITDKVKSEVGLSIESSSGEAKAKGITFAWDYDGSSTLKLTVESRSWYDPSEESIDKQLTAWVDSLK